VLDNDTLGLIKDGIENEKILTSKITTQSKLTSQLHPNNDIGNSFLGLSPALLASPIPQQNLIQTHPGTPFLLPPPSISPLLAQSPTQNPNGYENLLNSLREFDTSKEEIRSLQTNANHLNETLFKKFRKGEPLNHNLLQSARSFLETFAATLEATIESRNKVTFEPNIVTNQCHFF
jgi:hypothetical protein